MSTPAQSPLEARKQPRQARSEMTVEAIFDATIQVLLAVGSARLTTTRVAERAGVSVGTLYQYYPNKQALLYAVLQRHLERIVVAVENAAEQSHRQPLDVMTRAIVSAFVDAKTSRMDESRALYCVAGELETTARLGEAAERGRVALQGMLETATDARFMDSENAAYFVTAALAGTSRTLLENDSPAALLNDLKSHLGGMCLGYLRYAASA